MPFRPPKPIKMPRFGRPLVKAPSVKTPKVKVGGLGDLAKRPEALGAAIGAGVLFGVQALSNIKGKDGLSYQQRLSRARERHIQSDLDAKAEEGRPLGYSDRVKQITAKPYSELADLATEYPIRSALKVGLTGAMGGAAIARMLTKRASGPALAGIPKPAIPSATMPKMPGMPSLPKPGTAAMPKLAQEYLAIGDAWGRELAKEAFAGNMLFGQAARAITRSRWGGAGIGAAIGAARYAMSDDPNKSFIGSVGGGALAGGMAHQMVKGGLMAARKNKGQLGHFVRDSNRMAAKGEKMLKANPKADVSGIKGTEYLSPEQKAQNAARAKFDRQRAADRTEMEVMKNRGFSPAQVNDLSRGGVQPANTLATPAQYSEARASGLSPAEVSARARAGRLPSQPPPGAAPPRAPAIPLGPPPSPVASAPPPPATAATSPAAPPIAQPATPGPVRPPGRPMVPPYMQQPNMAQPTMKMAAARKLASVRLEAMRSRSLARLMEDA